MGITELAEAVRAGLAEDARIARAATQGRWKAEPYVYGPPEEGWSTVYDWEITVDLDRVVYHQPHEGGGIDRREDAEHIARHDPASVLRDVVARRRLLDEALSWRHLRICAVASRIAPGPCDCGRDERVHTVLQLLATPYQETAS